MREALAITTTLLAALFLLVGCGLPRSSLAGAEPSYSNNQTATGGDFGLGA